MGCSCRNPVDSPERAVLPQTYCPFCAEKHLSTAYALSHELGYASPNRQMVIGELVLAAWHVEEKHHDLAVRLRDLRHLIQLRRETETQGVFEELLSKINDVAEKENKEE